MLKTILKKILYKSKTIKKIRVWQIEVFPYVKMKWLNPNAVFLVNTPIHSNLGDHAIAKSEIDFLNKLNVKYIELTGPDLDVLDFYNSIGIMNNRTILIHGGGNLGTLWPVEEMRIRKIIINNKKSKIILFPNTIYYADSEQEDLKKSIEIYNSHPNLIICAREKTSYEFMKKIYRNVVLIPDMVFFLKEKDIEFNRNGCLVCLRNDKEKTMKSNTERELIDRLRKIFFDNINITDTVVGYQILVKSRNYELEKKLNEFRKAEIVITDRLHGMIFSAITGTPCIVFNSLSHKLKGCYEWIKSLEYIKFCDDVSEIPELIANLAGKKYLYEMPELDKYYEILKKLILYDN